MSYEGRRLAISDSYPRIWALWAATRPSQVLGIELVYVLGLAMAVAGPPLTTEPTTTPVQFGGPALIGALALAVVAVAVHYANEVADVDTDALTDRTAFSGGSGAVAETSLTAGELRRAWHVATGLSIAASVVLVAANQLPADAGLFLVLGLAVGVAYSARPLRLVRRGLGEATNAILVGTLVPLYAIAVVGRPTALAVVTLLPLTLLFVCAYLAIQWPDRRADAAVGKRTLAVQFVPTRLRRLYVGLASTAFAIALWLWLAGALPTPVALAHLAVLPLVCWAGATYTHRESPAPSVLAATGLVLTATVAWAWVGLVA